MKQSSHVDGIEVDFHAIFSQKEKLLTFVLHYV